MTIPKLKLDFTDASLNALITFTRTTGASSPATYVNSGGVITAAADNQPRFDYDPVALACKGLLVEESRENLFLYSDQLQQVNWIKSSVTVNDDAITSPDSTTNADKVIIGNGIASASGVIRQQITKAASAITYTCSFYAKAGEFNSVRVIFRDTASSANFVQAYFNLNLGTVSTGATAGGTYTGPSAKISAAGNGWYRCVLTGTTGANTTTDMRVLQYNNGNSSVIGDGVSGLYLWGAQLEEGPSPTSYIPTTATSLTRNADVATITGSNFSDFWQAGKGGAQVVAIPSTISGTRPLVQFDDGTANEIIALQGNAADPELYIVDGGTPQVQLDAGTITANASHTLTGWWDTNDCRARYDSGATVTDQTATIPIVTQMRIGSDGTNYLNGHIATIGYYDRFSGQVYSRRKNKAVFRLL